MTICTLCTAEAKLTGLCRRCYYREYEKQPKRHAWKKAYNKTEERKEYHRAFSKTDNFKTNMHRYQKTDKFKLVINKYQTSLNGKYKELIRTAKRRQIAMLLSFEEYCLLVANNECFYCYKELTRLGSSLDRKNNVLPYTVQNVVPCCGSCNRTKGDRLTFEEMVAISKVLNEMRKVA